MNNKEGREGKLYITRKFVSGDRPKQSRRTVGRLITAIFCVPLALSLAACSGNGVSDGAPTTATAHDMPDVAAAASAARASTVPLALARKINAGSVKTDSKTDRFIIKYKDGTTERSTANAVQSRLDKFASALPARAHRKRRMGVGADVVTTERKLNADETKAFMRAIASDPNVEYVEPDSDMQALMAPNDPDYRMQYYLRSNLPPDVVGIRAEGAWDITLGQGSVIAVVDDGFTSHSDLNANILPGLDIGSPDGRGWNPGSDGSCEVSFHGTHVAGIAAAVANNGIGIAGVAPGAKVESARALSPCGTGPLSDVVDGVIWAAGGTLEGVPANANPAKVINLSLGNWTRCSVTMQSAIDFATSKGAVVIAAAGNKSIDVSSMQPANCHNVIAVGGTDGYGNSYIDSNFGPGIDIAAPAKEIWSLYNDGTTVPTSEAYRYISGTSMATPMVSGVIALAQATRQTPLTVAEYRSLLRQSVQPFPRAPDRDLGPGILDATKTVTAARTGVIPAAADFTCHSEDSEDMWVHCEDLSTARGGAPIQTRTWDFGSSTSRTDFQDPLHFRYKYAGTYPVTLTVKDSNGQRSSYTRSVEVSAPATVDLPANTQTPFSGAYGHGVYFRTTVPTGTKSLTYTLQNTSDKYGAAAIYVNDAPSEMLPACSKTIQGDTFSCTVDSPKAGLWYAHYWVTSNSLSGATASVTVK